MSRPRGQHPQPPLDRLGLRQHIIDQLKRQVLGQLPQMTGGEDAPSDGNGMGDRGRGRLNSQRDLWRVGKIVTDRPDLPEVPPLLPPPRRRNDLP
jgi:hypothetical protein